MPGNLVPAGDEDWYQFTIEDENFCSPDTEIILLDASGAGLRMDVHRECLAGGSPELVAANVQFFNWSADCPGFADDVRLYVRVYDPQGEATCEGYTLLVEE